MLLLYILDGERGSPLQSLSFTQNASYITVPCHRFGSTRMKQVLQQYCRITKTMHQISDSTAENDRKAEITGSNVFTRGIFSRLREFQVVEELIELCKLAGPIVFTSFLMYSKSIISMLFMGYLGDTELAGGSLSIGFANITGYSILKGLATGMEPICSQAYGAKRWDVICQTYKKTLFLLHVAFIPISVLWFNTKPILLWLGQDPQITSVAQIYLKYTTLDLLAQVHFTPLRIFLKTQNLNEPVTVSAIFAMMLHIPTDYFLVVHFNMGVKGIALGSSLNTISLNLGLLIYLLISQKALKPWDGEGKTVFSQGWGSLLAYAVPCLISICLEWWWYELMLMLCGLLKNPQICISAMGILIQTTGMLYVLPNSWSSALSTRVGHKLGAELPEQAKKTTIVGLVLAVIWGLLACVFTSAIRNVWGKLYTSEPHILALVSLALPIVGFCEIGNCPQTTSFGILIGTARPKVGACIIGISFYIVGLPVAVLMTFKLKMGFLGLWYGLAASQATCVCMMLFIFARTDWDAEARRAKELTQAKEDEKGDLEQNLLSEA